jgi:hypothetical protein
MDLGFDVLEAATTAAKTNTPGKLGANTYRGRWICQVL